MQSNWKPCSICHQLCEVRRGVTFSLAFRKGGGGNSFSRLQPKAVLSPVSYRLLRRRRQWKRLLLKVPIATVCETVQDH